MAEVERFFTSPSSGDVGAPASTAEAGQGSAKKKKRLSSTGGGKRKMSGIKKPETASGAVGKDPTGIQSGTRIKRVLSGFNLAGRPGMLKEQEGHGVKSITKKFCRPQSVGTINTDSEWTFVIHSNKNEFVRFFANSLTASLYTTWANAGHDAASGVARVAAARWATVSLSAAPNVFFDPSVMATSMVKSVRVTINGVPVQTNNFMDPHFAHYVRCSRIFNSHPEPYLARQDLIVQGANRAAHSLAIKTGAKPFDHGEWNNQRSNRAPFFLDGIWPFDHRNRTLESIDKEPEPPLYLPPDSRIEITVELHRDKKTGVFLDNVNDYANYFGGAVLGDSTVSIGVKDVLLEYESCELARREHEEVIKQYREGRVANYDFDIVRSQHQSLEAGIAYSVKWFQIQPHCRLVYLCFLPNFATFPMPATKRPLSAWSRFPENCTGMKLSFAGEENLITEELENFGVNETNNEISKKIFFDYLTSKNMFVGSFDDFFSVEATSQSIIQILPLDLKHLESVKTERLTLELKFSGARLSPAAQQILCLSVHTNGRAICSADKGVHDWKWEFKIL